MNKVCNARGSGKLFRVLYRRNTGLIVSWKWCWNLCCSFRWLKSNLKRVNSFTPLISWTSKTEFSLGLTKFRIYTCFKCIYRVYVSKFLTKVSPCLITCGKKDDSKILVLAGRVFILFWVEDRVKYVLKLSHGIR